MNVQFSAFWRHVKGVGLAEDEAERKWKTAGVRSATDTENI